MSSTRPPRPSRAGRPGASRSGAVTDARRSGSTRMSPRTVVLLAVVGAAVVIALLVAALAGGDDDEATEAAPATPVSASGTALPPLPDEGAAPAVGTPMPVLTGTDLAGDPLTIGDSGRPTMVVFLAHWCPHCRAEVPVITDWVADGGLPEGVDLVAVATANDPARPNYPAADWLEAEGWPAPTLHDDADATAATAGGVSAFPFMVFVEADGTVAGRASGELTPAQLDAEVAALTGDAGD